MSGPKPIPANIRFWRLVDKSDECWTWTGATTSNGYGRFSVRPGEAYRAHRYAYALTSGPIAEGMQVDHICRTRTCVRPEHLRLVTPAQNSEHQAGHGGSRSGHRGVSWHKGDGKWQAKATKNGKTYHGGMHATIDEAAEAAKALRLSLFTHNDLDRTT